MSILTDRIHALTVYVSNDGVPMVSIEEVLKIVKDAVPVETDRGMYPGAPDADYETERTFAVVSTAYNLLADTAAEFASREIRRQSAAVGVEFQRSDEELFAASAENGGEVGSYRDLAERNPDRVEEIAKAFLALVEESTTNAMVGLATMLISRMEEGQ